MDLRTKIDRLDASICGAQRVALKELMGDVSWRAYKSMIHPSMDEDDDDIAISVFRFIGTLRSPDDFRSYLSAEQLLLVEEIEKHISQMAGL